MDVGSRPLKGVKVLEIAGLAPAPFCGLMLADFGATVIRVDRADAGGSTDTLSRGKLSIAVNLKSPEGIAVVKRLCSQVDVLIEPFRAGVLERLGLGPDVLLGLNPRLIVARLTGFGQQGPLSKAAGHDINYLSMGGVLGRFGPAGAPPSFPVNLLGDFAAGSLMCVFGILTALIERQRSNRGQVVDCAMIDGCNYLSSFLFTAGGLFDGPRGTNTLDGGAPFYKVYETQDGGYMAVGAIEPQFYKQLLGGLGLAKDKDLPDQLDRPAWPVLEQRFHTLFKSKPRSHWESVFGPSGSFPDACVTPVLEPSEMSSHPFVAPRSMIAKDPETGEDVPVAAPRLSRTPALDLTKQTRPEVGAHTKAVLNHFQFSQEEIEALQKQGAIQCTDAHAPHDPSKLRALL